MRSKTVVLLVLALGCGLVASIGISQVLQRNQDQGPAEESIPVWVALADIKNGDMLSAQNLKLEQWPREKVPNGALGKLEDIEGKKTRATIYQGEVVLEKKLRPGASFSASVPPGFRLYTVLADPVSSHGGLLQPGDRVDVMVYVNKSSGPVETGTKTILQDIKVFAINDQVSPTEDKTTEAITARTVTLLMTPSESEKAALAAEIGKIRLVMRGPNDKDQVNPAGTPLSALFTMEKTDRDVENMDRAPKPKGTGLTTMLDQAAKTPPPIADDQNFTMQIIKGIEITQSEFKRKFDDDSRWENGSIGVPPTDESNGNAAAPAGQDQSKKDPKAPAGKKDASKPNDQKSNDSGASHA